MGWDFEQIYNIAVNILLALAAAALLALCALVWRKAPGIKNPVRRLRVAVRRAPWASGVLSLVLVACVVIVVVGVVVAPRTTAASGPEGVKSAAPRSTPTPTPSSLAQAGWGPSRTLVKDAKRPKTAVINSVVDHPVYGDERAFMRIRLADDENATYSSSVIAEPGKVYEVIVAINNDAADGGATAKDVKLRLRVPGVAKGSAPSYAFISSSNVKPTEIWDGATLVGENTTDEFALRYVSNSAVLHTGGSADGTLLADDVFKQGTLVGCDALDGLLPAGERCQSWVTFKVRIDQPNFEVSAFAQLDETPSWAETFVASPGQQVKVLVTYKNTGTTQQDNVVLAVKLPDNMHLVAGSTTWSNARTQNVQASSDAIAGVGLNLGSYSPGANVYAEFDMIVDGAPGHESNIQSVKDFFTVETDNGNKSAPLTAIWL